MVDMKWIAIYDDGVSYSSDELESSEKIDRDRLREFRLYKENEEKPVFIAFFTDKENRKLIFRRRTFMSISGNISNIVYLVGWHENINGVSVKSICYVYEDGHIEFDSSRNDIELVPCEM